MSPDQNPSRAPIYGKGRQYRVVSRPNGYWRAEHLESKAPGRKHVGDQPHFDPWVPISRDTTKEAALALIPKD